MPQTKKGYISFIFFLLLSLTLLTPLLFNSIPPASISTSYSIQKTLNQQISFKRALPAASQKAFDDIKPFLQTLDSPQQTNLPITKTISTIPISISKHQLSTQTKKIKEEIIRIKILDSWAKLSKTWSSKTNTNISVYCLPAPNTPPIHPQTFSPSTLPNKNFLRLWNSCASQINFDYTQNKTNIKIGPRVGVVASHTPTNTSVAGEILSFGLN
ncbi:MAG: hypothetical protein ABIH83_03875 [Candidatus Micrarchaeota archaeon]